eukprot:UN22699
MICTTMVSLLTAVRGVLEDIEKFCMKIWILSFQTPCRMPPYDS